MADLRRAEALQAVTLPGTPTDWPEERRTYRRTYAGRLMARKFAETNELLMMLGDQVWQKALL